MPTQHPDGTCSAGSLLAMNHGREKEGPPANQCESLETCCVGRVSRVDTEQGPEITVLLLGMEPQELKGGPEEILAGFATAVQQDAHRGNSSHEVDGQRNSMYS